jgi:ribosomal protein L37AE/L43A
MRELEKGKPICIKCKKVMKQTKIRLGETKVRAWRCSKCGEELIHPLDAEEALLLAKLKKGVKLKVGVLNKAPYIRFPKEFSKLLRKGEIISVAAKAPNQLSVKINK